jgi:hypothetical protein
MKQNIMCSLHKHSSLSCCFTQAYTYFAGKSPSEADNLASSQNIPKLYGLQRFTVTIHYTAYNNTDVIVSAAKPKPLHTHGNTTVPSHLYMILISDMWTDRNNQINLVNFKLINK